MKKILLTISTAAFMFVGCDLDINDNPNYPQDDQVTPDLIFPAIQGVLLQLWVVKSTIMPVSFLSILNRCLRQISIIS